MTDQLTSQHQMTILFSVNLDVPSVQFFKTDECDISDYENNQPEDDGEMFESGSQDGELLSLQDLVK